MAMIHVARDGANIGSFSREEVQEGLRTGRFLPTDMAWEEGMPDWRPLQQVMAGKPAAAMPAAAPAEPNTLTAPTPSLGPETITLGSGLPWEHRQELGFFKAFVDTVSMVLTQPAVAFRTMKPEGDMTSPMLFALIGGSAGMIVSLLFQVALQGMGFLGNRQSMFGLGVAGVWAVGYIFLIPVVVILGMFIWGGILHVCLMIVGGARKPFETTFRVVCFSSGSTYLLSMIPFCGGMIAGVWNIVAQCIGLARAHEIDTGKAVLAVLLPLIVCCGGGLLCAILLGGFGALSQFSQH